MRVGRRSILHDIRHAIPSHAFASHDRSPTSGREGTGAAPGARPALNLGLIIDVTLVTG
jgi:hypothetical protein